MPAVYTISMASLKGTAGPSDNFGPPAGFRWVVKDVDFFVGNQIGTTTVYLAHEPGDLYWFAKDSPEEVQSWFQWSGRHVIDYPDSFIVYADGGNADVSVSGYQLAL